MRIACLQHVPFEGPAAIRTWATAHDFSVSVTHLFAREPLPALDTFELLVLLGGPMSVNDEDRFDWLRAEKQFVQHAIEARKHVLGICLGAQLIATALGAKVYPHTEREIGWFPVQRSHGHVSLSAMASLPETFTALHWHGETFDLPNGATQLAGTAACENQAFSVGNRVLGLQFHLESTPESVEALIRNCPGDLAPSRFVQAAHAMQTAQENFHESNRLLGMLLDRFLAVESARPRALQSPNARRASMIG